MQKIKIGLVQINNSFSNQNYFPYSVGILQAYAQKYLKDKEHVKFTEIQNILKLSRDRTYSVLSRLIKINKA